MILAILISQIMEAGGNNYRFDESDLAGNAEVPKKRRSVHFAGIDL